MDKNQKKNVGFFEILMGSRKLQRLLINVLEFEGKIHCAKT